MKQTALLCAILLLSAFSFAEEDCGANEENCLQACCEAHGGSFRNIEPSPSCGFPSGTPYADKNAFYSCAATTCRLSEIECRAPDSGCGEGYYSCYSNCVSGGQTAEYCDNSCVDEAISCLTDYASSPQPSSPSAPSLPSAPPLPLIPSKGNSCCGGFALAFGALGIFLWRNQ